MKYVLLCFMIVCCRVAIAQDTTANPQMSQPQDIRETLVNLAMQNPDLEVLDYGIKVAEYQIRRAKSSWLNNISLSANMNEFTVKNLQHQTNQEGQYYPYYPIYNASISLPIGAFFSKDTKIAKQELAIAKATRNSKYREIRATVLTLYEDYLSNKELLTVQAQLTESKYNNFLQAKEKFRNGQISVDDYNKAAQEYHAGVIQRITSAHDFNVTKIELEKLIGVPVESVLNNTYGSNNVADSIGVQ